VSAVDPVSFRPCAIVPTYNNPLTLGRVVEGLLAHVSTVIVVDDGSNPPVTGLNERFGERVRVVRRPSNGGKGAAVKDGLRLAWTLGFSHGLQVDADGQHDLASVPAFLDAARKSPGAVVFGYPVFDDSVSRLRRAARQLSIFWARVETQGRHITDPLCGFRVYPLAPALATHSRGCFMDFDPEIAVRLVWAGIPTRNLPVPVRYLTPEEGGVSHFRVLADNLRISWMHTRLVVALLWAWCRLRRWPESGVLPNPERQGSRNVTTTGDWKAIPEAGNAIGVVLITWISLKLGRSAGRFFLRAVALHYVLFSRRLRRVSRDYLPRVGLEPSFTNMYRHVFHFAQCSADRLFFAQGDLSPFDVHIHGHEHLRGALAEGKGGLLLGAHLGSFEAMRALSASMATPISAVVDYSNSRLLTALLQRLESRRETPTTELLQADTDAVQLQLVLRDRLQSGGLVGLLADRATGGKLTRVQFLGGKAELPTGPYVMACQLGCPMFVTAALFQQPNRYDIFFEPLVKIAAVKQPERAAVLDHWAQQYAFKLESLVRQGPLNWFNFYDFWNAEHGE
jgi:predicted LPLAT superfamily acyltransferase